MSNGLAASADSESPAAQEEVPAYSWYSADLHEMSGPYLRGLGIGIFFSTVNLMAYGIGSPLIGKLNDKLGVAAHPEQMRYALLVCPAACTLAALLLWLGSRAREASAEG